MAKHCATPETSFVSSRTGGFEVPREEDQFPCNDDDTLMDCSIYTDPHRMSVGRQDMALEEVCSQASTVHVSSRRPSPLYTDDIQKSIDRYKSAIQSPPVMSVTVKSTPPTTSSTPSPSAAAASPVKRSLMGKTSPTALSKSPSPVGQQLRLGRRRQRSTPENVASVDLTERETPVRSNQSFRTTTRNETSSRTTPTKTNTSTPPRDNDKQPSTARFLSFTENGEGFELSPREKDEEDDSSTDSSLDLQVNKSDSDLMKNSSDSGVLRLTAEGLKSHEQISLHQSMTKQPDDKFEQWKRKKQKQTWLRERHNERREKLTDQSIRQRQSLETGRNEEASKPGAKFRFREKEDTAGFSLAPLNAMEHLNLHMRVEPQPKPKALALFDRIRKKRDVSATAQSILQKERQAAVEAQKQKQMKEFREKERIERKRRVYLEQQRAMEADVSHRGVFQASLKDGKPATTGNSSYIASLELVRSSSPRPGSQSPAMSTTTSNLPPCVVCKSSERTHIAMPCLHFSFCQACVAKVAVKSKNSCPVCFALNVTYAAVSV